MNVLVVDDEPIMSEAYKTLIDWDRNGFSLVGCASNGAKALEIMRTVDVDIVITDLKMPIMSGLELIGAAREEFPEARFVVMSAYDEFTLVKEAYSMGVKEYFLKAELEPDAVLETLSNIKQEIEEERIVRENAARQTKTIAEVVEKDTFEKIIHNNRIAICERLLKELIWGNSYDENKERLSKYGISLTADSLGIMVFSLYNYYDEEKEVWKGEREIFKYAILNILDEVCHNYGAMYPFCNLPHEFVVIFSESEVKYSNSELEGFFEDVRNAMQKYLGLGCDCGYGGIVNGYAKLKDLYSKAEMACRYGFAYGHGRFMHYDWVNKMSPKRLSVSEYVQNMRRILSDIEKESPESALCKLRISPADICPDNVSDVKKIFYMYYVEIISFFDRNDMRDYKAENVTSFENIKDYADLSEYNNWLSQSLNEIYDIFKLNTNIVSRAKKYINQHYKEQINLSSVADFLGISTGHLSRTFQDSEGQSVKQYLLNFRMNKAVALLKSTNLKVYEVAREVGYTNVEQFSKMFKKIIGKPPKSFGK